MRKVENYIDSELAKKKIARYRFWSIKDENGITIVSSDDNPEGKSFGDYLDKIIHDNVDAEVQVKYGTTEQSSRQNPPFFIKINQEIEWIDPVEEEPEQVTINGVKHKVDKNGHVNINLATSRIEEPKVEPANYDFIRQEMDMQLEGLRREHEMREEKMKVDLQNKLFEQTLSFKEMMLKEREAKIAEREQALAAQEAILEEKEKEVREDVKGYIKHVPSVLGGFIKDFLKGNDKSELLGKTEQLDEKPQRERKEVEFEIEVEPEETESDEQEIQSESND